MTGCRWKFLAWLENNLDVVGATALAFAILHVCSAQLDSYSSIFHVLNCLLTNERHWL